MKKLLLLLPLYLGGCVTVEVQPYQPQATSTPTKPVTSCPIYQRPAKSAAPTGPDLGPEELTDLEALGLKLAAHIRGLYDHIDKSERQEAQAYSLYLERCKPE